MAEGLKLFWEPCILALLFSGVLGVVVGVVSSTSFAKWRKKKRKKKWGRGIRRRTRTKICVFLFPWGKFGEKDPPWFSIHPEWEKRSFCFHAAAKDWRENRTDRQTNRTSLFFSLGIVRMESHLNPPAVNPGSRGMINGARVLRGILENYEFNSPCGRRTHPSPSTRHPGPGRHDHSWSCTESESPATSGLRGSFPHVSTPKMSKSGYGLASSSPSHSWGLWQSSDCGSPWEQCECRKTHEGKLLVMH